MKIGQKVTLVPSGFEHEKEAEFVGFRVSRQVTGRVVWVHPRGRFYVVEYQVNGHTLRESVPMEGGVANGSAV